MTELTFTLLGDVAVLNANARMHPGKRIRLTKEWRTNAGLVLRSLNLPPFTKKIRISYVVYRGRQLDDDNIYGACKHIRDALKDVGLVPDDSPLWVEMGSVQQVVAPEWKAWPKGKGPKVKVHIQAVDDAKSEATASTHG